MRGLPPMLIQAGEDEILLDDAKRLAKKARHAGVDVTFTTDSAKFGVHLTDIVVENLNYEGYVNLIARVLNRLKDFEV